jgi:phospholipid/cholesterol/gamma-HCH transport system substrate-binding protein
MQKINNIKLGLFVLFGLLFLVLLLYMIGKNKHLFGNTYTLKANFENIQGLSEGNNVRFSGIQVGTVKKIKIINDTAIEIVMIIEKRMSTIIKKNAMVSIGSEGIVGNKVVNIIPSKQPSVLAQENDLLASKKASNTDEMLQTLNKTNNDIAFIVDNLKTTTLRINNSTALWALLNDNSIPQYIKASIQNIQAASNKAVHTVENLNTLVGDVKHGKGSLGAILTDDAFAKNLNETILKIKSVGDEANVLISEINKVTFSVKEDIHHGKGIVNTLLKDSLLVANLNSSLDNIQKGTDGFNQNMEALKHNILFRSYFKKLERKKKKLANSSLAIEH